MPQRRGLVAAMQDLARKYLLACQTGEPVLLSREEMTAVRQRFFSYGPDSA